MPMETVFCDSRDTSCPEMFNGLQSCATSGGQALRCRLIPS